MADEKDDRLFAPFSIEMDEHPKIIGISDAAFRALFEGTFYSRRMLTDGFLDRRVVVRRWGQAAADELSANDPEQPSWIPVEHGWQIHDFEKHHPLRAEIMAKRAGVSEKRSEAGKRGAAKRWHRPERPLGHRTKAFRINIKKGRPKICAAPEPPYFSNVCPLIGGPFNE